MHKSQGSEFDHVGLVLPDDDVSILTKEVLYTAMTRARRSVSIIGRADRFGVGLGRAVERFSGVLDRLELTLSDRDHQNEGP